MGPDPSVEPSSLEKHSSNASGWYTKTPIGTPRRRHLHKMESLRGLSRDRHSKENLTQTDPLTKNLADIPHIPSKFVEFVPLSHRQGNCIPYAAIRWHDFGNRPALGRPLGHFSRHPDTPLLSLSPRRRFPRPTPERVFVADHQSSSGFSGTGPSAPPPQPIGT